jgi:dipeptidyl aminopeptidase/acylaminoacyl peptidase
MLLASAAGLCAAATLPVSAHAAFPRPEVPPVQTTTYVKARALFRTELLQKGPAPGDFEQLGTPAGAKRVSYPGGPDGAIKLTAWVSPYQPSSTLRPAVLFLHGGNATGHGHWELMKPYADAGFVVMLPTLRGENGQKGSFSGFYDEVDDTSAAARYLEELPGIDRSRIFLAGHSVGGTLSLLTAMNRKFCAAVPISSNPDAWRFFGRFQEDIRFNPKNPQEFVMRSAVCFAHSVQCPMLLLRGTEEGRFQQRHSLFIERARAGGVSIDQKQIPGDHNGAVPGAIAESIRFFNRVAG